MKLENQILVWFTSWLNTELSTEFETAVPLYRFSYYKSHLDSRAAPNVQFFPDVKTLRWYQQLDKKMKFNVKSQLTTEPIHVVFRVTPINQSVNQSINRSINSSLNQSINQSSINQPSDQPINRSIKRLINQSINRMTTWGFVESFTFDLLLKIYSLEIVEVPVEAKVIKSSLDGIRSIAHRHQRQGNYFPRHRQGAKIFHGPELEGGQICNTPP